MTDVRNRAWLWGGVALIASAIAQFALPSSLSARGIISALLLAAGLALFAFGGGVRRNIFGGGHVLGAAAAVVLAALLLTTGIIELLPGSGTSALNEPGVSSVVDVARLALALILVVQVGRSPIFSATWRWAPLWAVLAQVLNWVVFQFVLINAGRDEAALATFATSWSGVVPASVPIFIGVLAILAAVTVSPSKPSTADRAPASEAPLPEYTT